MKNIIVVLFCVLLISCFSEPKKETPIFESIQNTQVNHIDSVDSIKINNVESVNELKTENNSSSLSDISPKRKIINEINLIAENNGFPNMENKLSFLNEKKGLMLFYRYEFNINNVYAVYLNKDYNNGFGSHYVSIECEKKESGSNCLYDTIDSQYISASIFPLKNKESCLKYVEMFNTINMN